VSAYIIDRQTLHMQSLVRSIRLGPTNVFTKHLVYKAKNDVRKHYWKHYVLGIQTSHKDIRYADSKLRLICSERVAKKQNWLRNIVTIPMKKISNLRFLSQAAIVLTCEWKKSSVKNNCKLFHKEVKKGSVCDNSSPGDHCQPDSLQFMSLNDRRRSPFDCWSLMFWVITEYLDSYDF
jgi:hypothetical protein